LADLKKPYEKTFENVDLTIDGPKAQVRLNRPHKKNALSPDVHRELGEALVEIARDGGVKAVVVTGVGDSFCAGMDLEKCFFEPFDDPEEFRAVNAAVFEWSRLLKAFPAVTIASVNGYCFGGGFELAAICDIAVAAEEATFGLSEINFGIFPAGGAMWATAHNLNRKRALYYSLTGEPFDGRLAAEMGLINRAVPREKLEEETERIVGMIVDKNILTLRATKEVYEKTVFMEFPESIEWEMAKLAELSYYSRDTWINRALAQFKERKYRPGFDAYELGDGE
jgi:trans-feruloyl-CoA hydratase/vanillin synthase